MPAPYPVNLMRRLLLALTFLLVAGGGCVGPADPDPRVQEPYRTAAAPLLAAHERLDEYKRAVAQGDDRAEARALWPDVRDDVRRVLDTYDPGVAGDLGPAERSTLVGYLGGLRRGLEAWEEVDAAIRAGEAGADIDETVAAAREHMRFLEGLRDGAF